MRARHRRNRSMTEVGIGSTVPECALEWLTHPGYTPSPFPTLRSKWVRGPSS